MIVDIIVTFFFLSMVIPLILLSILDTVSVEILTSVPPLPPFFFPLVCMLCVENKRMNLTILILLLQVEVAD